MQMQGGKNMLKKISKRDKTEELEWQSEVLEKILILTMCVASIAGLIFTIISVVLIRNKLFVLFMIPYSIIFILIGLMYLKKNLAKTKIQVEENVKSDKKQKILDYIRKKEFSKLSIIDEELIQKIIQESIKNETINIEELINNSIYITIKNNPPIYLMNSNDILNYFDITD